MEEDIQPYMTVDSYTVSKQFGRFARPPLVFKDPNGNILLTAAQGGFTGSKATLVNQQGKLIGAIQKKGIQLGNKATYYFFDGANNQIGQIKVSTSIMGMSEKVLLEDQNGNTVAVATGNFAGFNYEIMDVSGANTLAKISRNTQNQQGQQDQAGLKGMLKSFAEAAINTQMGVYKIDIIEKSINNTSRLFILELVIVLDGMYHPQNSGAAGFGGPAGFGVGGIKI